MGGVYTKLPVYINWRINWTRLIYRKQYFFVLHTRRYFRQTGLVRARRSCRRQARASNRRHRCILEVPFAINFISYELISCYLFILFFVYIRILFYPAPKTLQVWNVFFKRFATFYLFFIIITTFCTFYGFIMSTDRWSYNCFYVIFNEDPQIVYLIFPWMTNFYRKKVKTDFCSWVRISTTSSSLFVLPIALSIYYIHTDGILFLLSWKYNNNIVSFYYFIYMLYTETIIYKYFQIYGVFV